MIDFSRVFNNLIVVGVIGGIGFWIYSKYKKPSFSKPDKEDIKNIFRGNI